MIGETLARYKILSKLGAGGMGEVYLAEDTELGREVALKILPPALAENPERLERFRREARAVAALNHRNIVTIYNVEEVEGRRLLVMERVNGRSLDKIIPRQGLALERVFEIAVPMADALAAAHERGITHRDLKPSNVMVTEGGTVKVLDFGLAKLAAEAAAPDEVDGATQAATRTATLTGEGTVMGTAPYMSPEQLSGKAVDHRSDIFSLGIVLYEMVAGRRPFQGETGIELASSILKDSPSSVTEIRGDLPRHLGRIIQHCLEKDPERRYQSVKDVRNELDQLHREVDSGQVELTGKVATIPAERRSSKVRLVFAALALIAAAVVVILVLRPIPDGGGPQPPTPLSVAPATEPATFAVLPFRNMGADATVDYLRLAVPDEITTTLSRAPGLAVRPFSMTSGLDSQNRDPVSLGTELGVNHVIAGQYLQEGDRLSLTLEAIDVDGQVVVWRQSIAAGAHELISLREQVASTVAGELLPKLGHAAANSDGTRPTDERAYDLYLRSLSFSTEVQPNQEAIDLLEEAIEIDPDYAPSWSQLASRYYYVGAYGGGSGADYDRSVAAGERALALDPDLVDPATRIIIVAVERGRLTEAWEAANRLVERRPRAARAHFVRGYVSRYAGDLEGAVRDCDTALALDPRNHSFRSCGIANSQAGDYDKALRFFDLDRDSTFALDNMAKVRMRQGRLGEAAELFRRSDPVAWESIIDALEDGDLSVADRDAWVDGTLALTDSEQPYWAGSILARLGEHRSALELIAASVERGYCSYPLVERDPLLAGLRSDPSVAELYAEVRDAGRACREAFLAQVGG